MKSQFKLNDLHNALAEYRDGNAWQVVYFEVNGIAYYVQPHAYGLSVVCDSKQLFVVRFKHYSAFNDSIRNILHEMLEACYDKICAKFGA